jgi:hypothetical protein
MQVIRRECRLQDRAILLAAAEKKREGYLLERRQQKSKYRESVEGLK